MFSWCDTNQYTACVRKVLHRTMLVVYYVKIGKKSILISSILNNAAIG